MAANFWASSHNKQWILQRETVEKSQNKRDKEELKLTDEEIKRIKIHFSTEIQSLGRRLSLRQRVIASAIVYFRRFYVKCNFLEFCPRLISATCLYISTKVEECSTQSPAYRIANEMKKHDPSWPYTTNHLLECEFYILETMQFFMIIFHPYRPLVEYLADCKFEKGPLETAWHLVNDSYCTDLSLYCVPYIIALAAINIASITFDIDLRLWFSELNVDMREVWTASNELLSFYEMVKKEKTSPHISQILAKLPTFPHYQSTTTTTTSTSNANAAHQQNSHHQQVAYQQNKPGGRMY